MEIFLQFGQKIVALVETIMVILVAMLGMVLHGYKEVTILMVKQREIIVDTHYP